MVSVIGDEAFLLHFTQLIGPGDAVHAKIVSKVLPVKGKAKRVTALARSLYGQICENPVANGRGGYMVDFLG